MKLGNRIEYYVCILRELGQRFCEDNLGRRGVLRCRRRHVLLLSVDQNRVKSRFGIKFALQYW